MSGKSKVPSVSPVTGKPVPETYLHASDTYFRDTSGRAVLLRGVNLSGSSKAPVDHGSQRLDNFWDDAEAGKLSFVGRPLGLEDGSADTHLARLRAWGFNCLRFVFTWEAIEHAGPGKYDDEYMDYVVRCLYKCKEWGFRVFMDPHQDVWSRFTGGSGAPIWTLYACGMDPRHITATYAALVHCEYPSAAAPAPQSFPGMIWGTNYTRLASETLFTLFFAGRTFAPRCIIDGVNIQDWLQSHFTNAVAALAEKVAAAPGLCEDCVVGWDSMNEPGEGLIGHPDIGALNPKLQLKKGPMTTPFEGMRLGMGEAVEVDEYDFGAMGPKKARRVVLDPKGVKLWLDPEEEATRGGGKWGWKRSPDWKLGTCIWAQHGVWETSTSSLRKPQYFAHPPTYPTKTLEFTDDFFTPHFVAYAKRIRAIHPESILFVQAPVFHPPPRVDKEVLGGRACSSCHFYDGLTLMTKHWNWFNADALGMLRGKYWNIVQAVRVGETAIRNCVQGQLAILKQDTKDVWGDFPTLIGEIGCPYDMDGKRAYGYVDGGKGEGDYSQQQTAWDCSLNAADGNNCLNYTMWTYCPDSSHQWGDNWNGEDLSIWNPDDTGKIDFSRASARRPESPSSTISTSSSAPSSATSSKTKAAGPTGSVASLASSTTLTALPADKQQDEEASALSPTGIAAGDGVTPRLLLDGARAIGAIARPYPVYTVGTPERIEFDLRSTRFQLSVRVDPASAAAAPAAAAAADEVCTVIYLPFIHYAAHLGGASGSSGGTGSGKGFYSNSANSSRVSLLQGKGSRSTSSSRSSTPTPATPTSATPVDPSAPLALSIEVHTTHGRTEQQGQYLRWYYPAPGGSSSEVYRLEVRRKGGSMVRAEQQAQTGGWTEVLKAVAGVDI